MTPPTTPEPGANPLDTPEARRAVFTALRRVSESWDAVSDDSVPEAQAADEVGRAVLAALAPFVAAAQAAAWRAGVEAAADKVREMQEVLFLDVEQARVSGLDEARYRMALGALEVLAEMLPALSVPAAFAAPWPPTQALHAAFWRGRGRGREDAAEACQRYAALLRDEANECHEACDDAGEADALTRAAAADGCAAFIEQLGPADDQGDDDAGPDSLAGLGVAP